MIDKKTIQDGNVHWEFHYEPTVSEIIDYKVDDVYIVDDVLREKLHKFVSEYILYVYYASEYNKQSLFYSNLVQATQERIKEYKDELSTVEDGRYHMEVTRFEFKLIDLQTYMRIIADARFRVLEDIKKNSL